jgi:hypothetical protein
MRGVLHPANTLRGIGGHPVTGDQRGAGRSQAHLTNALSEGFLSTSTEQLFLAVGSGLELGTPVDTGA